MMESPNPVSAPIITKKIWYAPRLPRTTISYAIFISGAVCVALIALAFAALAESMLALNLRLTQAHRWAAFVLLPFGFAGLRWLTIRYAMQSRGSGIPQVIAAMSLASRSPAQNLLVSLRQACWKIVLTAGALLAGASSGREGPSVQVGAAVMAAWGHWWHVKLGLRSGFAPQALIAAGAAGGLAAAFNTPLAGVVFAIEELGHGSPVRWDRIVLSGVLTAGFVSLALVGNSTYFHVSEPMLLLRESWKAVIVCALINGVLGGLFSRLLIIGVPAMLPRRLRSHVARYPIQVAFACGAVVALLGWFTGGATYGTGYAQAASLLNGHPLQTLWFGAAKWVATIVSYFAGIPGGIFTPSLAIGAGIGENIAHVFQGLTEPRILALLSMAAFLAAATQAPITASVIVMEMTHDQDTTLYLLAVTLIASFVARTICRRPFYHAVARRFRREALEK